MFVFVILLYYILIFLFVFISITMPPWIFAESFNRNAEKQSSDGRFPHSLRYSSLSSTLISVPFLELHHALSLNCFIQLIPSRILHYLPHINHSLLKTKIHKRITVTFLQTHYRHYKKCKNYRITNILVFNTH